MSGNKIVKTPIVYYGGKTSIQNHLLDLVPIHETYFEGFAGGATLFFAKDPVKNETINDRLQIVVNFYRTLKLKFKPLKRLIDATLIGRDIHNQGLKLINAHKAGKHVNDVKLAWAFWMCTNFAYSNKIGGGYKYSNDMSVSVPQTLSTRKSNFTDALVARIEHCYIENDDCLKIANSRNRPKTFNYFDPPYPGQDQGHYGGRALPGGAPYGWDDYEKLLIWCATKCTGKFLLSSYNSEMLDGYTKIYGWNKKEITHKISGIKSHNPAKNRYDKTEVLIYNYTPHGTLKLF